MKFYPNSPQERFQVYRSILEENLKRNERGLLPFQSPKLKGLRSRKEKFQFHATPELFFQLSGKTRYTFPFQQFSSNSNSVTLVPCNMPHFEEGFRSQGKFLEMILMFNPEGFSLHLASCRPDRRILSGPIDVFPSRHNRQLIQYLDDIAESCHTIKAPELLARCLLSAVLCILIRESHRASSYPQTEHSKVSRARNIISAEFTNAKLTVTQIAEDIQCSADYLSRLFQQETGQTLINYLNNRRIEHAQHLLKNSDLNCAEIAWASGYSSPSYFNRVFVQRLQVTPKVFRSLH